MRRSTAARTFAMASCATVALALAASGVFAQQQPAPVRPAPVPPKPIAQSPAPAAKPATAPSQAAPTQTAPRQAVAPKPATPKPPVKQAVAGAPDTAAPKKVVSPAQKVPPAARRAAAIAAKTAQAVPPDHQHVSKAYTGTCNNPDALGVSRVLEVDTTDGLYLGQLYQGKLPLGPKEVVLTFDDGPVPHNTDRVLAALEKECVKATYFIVGQMAKAYPDILRRTAAAGHTIGYHTMTHPLDMVKRPLDWAKGNISGGWQTVDQILYGKAGDKPVVPFFRYPGLFNSRAINEWLNGLNVGVFAADAVGNDWVRGFDAQKVMEFSLKDMDRAGQSGILLLHDTKDSTATMMPQLLRELKARGYKVVHLVPKGGIPPLATGPVAGALPDAGPAPLGQRNVAGFDAGRQLVENAQGRTGKTSDAPLPAYDQNALARTVAGSTGSAAPGAAAAPSSTEDGWFASTATSFRGLGSAIGLW